jgi:hypothetical protein
MAFPSLVPVWGFTSYTRTLLSHDDTARKSPVDEKEISEMLSVGGDLTSTSLERSPCDGTVEVADEGKRPDMVTVGDLMGKWLAVGQEVLCCCWITYSDARWNIQEIGPPRREDARGLL